MSHHIEFSRWQEWNGSQVAFFISTFCELPQYADAIGQNLTGAALERLSAANMLHKGLARAGVCDFDHQRQIAAAVGRLESHTPEELNQELDTRLEGQHLRFRKKPRMPPTPSRTAGSCRPQGCFVALHLLDLEALSKPRVASPTTARMQRPSSAGGSCSSAERHTPRPWVSTGDQVIRGSTVEDAWDVHAQRLRKRLAGSLTEYEDMREAAAPIYGTICFTPQKPDEARGQRNSLPGRQLKTSDGIIATTNEVVGKSSASSPRRAHEHVSKPSTAGKVSEYHQQRPRGITTDDLFGDFAGAKTVTGAIVIGNEAMLGSELQGEDSAAGGVRGIQQIQAQRSQQKAPLTPHSPPAPKPASALDTMSQVLGGDAEADPYLLGQKTPTHRKGSSGLGQGDQTQDFDTTTSYGQSPPSTANDRRPSRDMKDENKAATTLQCRVRQRQAMREAELKRHEKKTYHHKTLLEKEEEQAATKIQAICRGNATRKQQQEASDRLTQRKKTKAQMEEELAATKIQAIQRGKKARQTIAERTVAEREAATRIQALYRGKTTRRKNR